MHNDSLNSINAAHNSQCHARIMVKKKPLRDVIIKPAVSLPYA